MGNDCHGEGIVERHIFVNRSTSGIGFTQAIARLLNCQLFTDSLQFFLKLSVLGVIETLKKNLISDICAFSSDGLKSYSVQSLIDNGLVLDKLRPLCKLA